MKRKALIPFVVGIALLVAPAAQALVLNDGSISGSTQVTTSHGYIAGVTDFPAASPVATRYVPGMTDFPKGSVVEPPSTISASSNDGIEWGNASIVALAAALGLAMFGSALVVRRRVSLAH